MSASSRFSLSSLPSPSPSLYSHSHSPSASTLAAANQNRRESARASQPSSLQQQLFGSSTPAPLGPQNIQDRPLGKSKLAEVGLGAWSFLFAEVVAYSQSRVDSVSDLEARCVLLLLLYMMEPGVWLGCLRPVLIEGMHYRLSSLGYDAGQRILPLLLLRNTQSSGIKEPKREHRLIPILQFIHTQVYRYCFGKPADGLERSVEEENEYMITLNQPPLTQFISVPKDMSQLSCEAFTAGIVEGVLDGLEVPARVTAHTVPTDQFPQRTVILIKLDQKVMDREEALGK
ncbi:BET3 family protein [Cryptococcus wingfieldii CBS 7118]|uniref:BET3 family protein n=1 Tax=Cryptococcus wingfieldii CBS 7118 TaxID=1295528 RepID=A0A1E3JR74_9TREE|nr:BET3 family protein [Cryptococcus wingfieldii CBS 7118]ODO03364.1 BET3 family protein [Cryptococcus wingfieldii CBS 7118]